MKTEKPLTSISYNTPEFLKAQCDKLVKSGTIDFYAFIKHKGEADPFDGVRDKDHIHILVRPLKAVQTATFTTHFIEIDKTDTAAPLGCVRFDKCKNPGTWVLYSLHYSPYLDSIGEKKEFYNYDFHDFVTNNEQELRRYRKSVPIEYKPKLNTVMTLLNQGCSRSEILNKVNPSAVQYSAIDKMVAYSLSGDSDYTVTDNRTGEIIYGGPNK